MGSVHHRHGYRQLLRGPKARPVLPVEPASKQVNPPEVAHPDPCPPRAPNLFFLHIFTPPTSKMLRVPVPLVPKAGHICISFGCTLFWDFSLLAGHKQCMT